jgi:hypothetical protein
MPQNCKAPAVAVMASLLPFVERRQFIFIESRAAVPDEYV